MNSLSSPTTRPDKPTKVHSQAAGYLLNWPGLLAMEPDWGEGYYILSEAQSMEVWLGTSKSPKESLDEAIALSEKAVSLDDSLS